MKQEEGIDFPSKNSILMRFQKAVAKVVTPGVQGERAITTRIYTSNGQEVDSQDFIG